MASHRQPYTQRDRQINIRGDIPIARHTQTPMHPNMHTPYTHIRTWTGSRTHTATHTHTHTRQTRAHTQAHTYITDLHQHHHRSSVCTFVALELFPLLVVGFRCWRPPRPMMIHKRLFVGFELVPVGSNICLWGLFWRRWSCCW